MILFFKLFFTSALSFALLDFLWLGYIIAPFNLRHLADIGRFKGSQFDLLLGPAIMTYVLMAASVFFFVLPKVAVEDSLWSAFLTGSLMGLIIYGVFDMTNLAILKNYPLPFALVDIAWGTFVFGAVTLITKSVRDW